MSEYISLNDTVYFITNFYHPESGFSCVADETPAWYVYESGATQILNGNMTARDGIIGSYWGNFIASAANNFVTGRYYDVQVSGMVSNIPGFSKMKDFVLGDIYDSNVVQVSGEYVALGSDIVTVNAQEVWEYSGGRGLDQAVSVSGIPTVNVVQVSGEYVYSDSIIDANIVQVSGVNISLTESIDANLVTVKGEDFSLNDAVSVSGIVDSNVVQVSGEYVTIGDFRADSVSVDAATIWTYETRALTEAVSVSGIPDVNVIQVSGEYVDKEALRADISSFENDIYFANIKYISDLTNNADEFAVQWFKNDQPISSGDLTEPCLSVYNTSNGNSLIINQSMNYASSVLGVVRHNESPMVMVSGEPYLIETSGTIDSVVRIWKNIVGIDLL